MSRGISTATKKKVAVRAEFRCEYCLLPERLSFYSFHIEHIRSIKHGGSNDIVNLAYCCPDCNYYKGSDVGTFVDDEILTRFYNPRKDQWGEHFYIEEGVIYSKTDIGKATVLVLKFNEVER